MSLSILAALIAPLVAWPIEYFFPYPHLVEELLKGSILYFSWKPHSSKLFPLLIGLAFTLTESVLYLPGILQFNHPSVILVRVISTFLMHSATTYIIFLPGQIKKSYIWLALLPAILIHYLYNRLLGL